MKPSRLLALVAAPFLAIGSLAMVGSTTTAQMLSNDRLSALPGFDTYSAMQDQLRAQPVYVSGALNVTWADDSRSFSYADAQGRRQRFDVAALTASTLDSGAAANSGPRAAAPRPDACPPMAIARGRQRPCATSPDGARNAYSRDRNVFLSDADGTHELALTSDGSSAGRIKYGTASWVYGEELDQTTAIWWSPDSRRVAFYRFDESKVQDYYLQTDQVGVQDSLDVEAYPKAGTANPQADLVVYDLGSKRTTVLDVRDGQPFADDVLGHYVYAVTWAPDGSELRLNRMNRRQQVIELIGCSPVTAKCRVILHDEWTSGWIDYRPVFRALDDGRRFIWESHRQGWLNYYLYSFSGGVLNAITHNTGFDSERIVTVDEERGLMFYMARDGDNTLKLQLHSVRLDGTNDRRLTDAAYNHAVRISPDSRLIVDVYQAHDRPPATRLIDADGKVVAELATSDMTRFNALGLRPVETFTYKAADGVTTLIGTIAFPAHFDPSRSYPALVPVYGGPAWSMDIVLDGLPTENFTLPALNTEFGFLVVTVSSRAAPGLGRRALDAIYGRLGQTEMDDMALGIQALWSRPYFDRDRVGVYGTSYGGYTAVMELLRHPDVFAAGVASSPPTDWRLYDTIYTERYMGTPQDNPEGYAKASAMTYASALRGRLLVYYGTADNNVHPSNALGLIQALQRAGKSFEVQVGPDAEHSSLGMGRMMEFLVENLIQRPERLKASAARVR
ncbi:MAG: DPP IV N-terminal domain-containing protein [Acidobacteriota bacterium]